MEIKDRLRKLLEEQKVQIKDFEGYVKEFESNDIINQNSSLKKELEQYKLLIEETKQKYKQIQNENSDLKIALKEQILDEKLNILKISRKKIETYFNDISSNYSNRLIAFEQNTLKKIDELKNITLKELDEDKDGQILKLKVFHDELQERIKKRKQEFEASKDSILNDMAALESSISEENISEELLKKRIKQNDIEVKIGLSWLNKIGIFIILIGVITAMKYTYSNFFNNYTKGISAFILGALFLGAGEWLSRKAKNIAALGLTGGGIAILYLSIFSSYFILKPRIISLEAGILLSILVTVIALVLSLYYKSKTILSFALIGGYFPFFAFVFSFGLDEKSIYIAMGYLFMLNLLTLLISFYKKWDIVNYISFILNVPTLIYLVFKANNQLFAISYSLLTFAMYLVITLLYPLKLKLKLKVVDIILLGLNTFISCLIIYLLFEKAGFSNFRGLLAVVFCLIYFGIGKFMKITMKEENSTQALFYLTAFAFAILIIPFQFGVSWLSIGWLVEGILLILYGFRFKVKNYEYGGWILFGFCLFAFYFIDVPTRISGYETITTIFKCISIFDFKFFSILAGLLLTMFMYLNSNSDNAILKYSTRGKAVTALKYFTVLNTWAFLLYASVEFYNNIIIKNNIFIDYYEGFYKIVLLVFVTAALAFAITKIKLLYDKAIRGFSIFLYILVDLACIITNMDTPLFGNGDNYLEYLSIGILLIYNVMVFLSIKDLLLLFLKKNELNFEAFPLLISAYLLSSLTAILIVQFNLGGYNLLFSLIYLVAAFVMIIYGFKKKFVLMRRFGLGLSVFSTAKLFIYDLRFLETAGKIVSYFAFGLVLVGISLIYQRFSKSLQRTIDI